MELGDLLDFSALKTRPAVLMEAAKISSSLIANDSFFGGPVRDVLSEIALNLAVDRPTDREMELIRERLPCQVLMTEDRDVYMQCAPEKRQIFVSMQVNISFQRQFFNALLLTSDSCHLIVRSGWQSRNSKKMKEKWIKYICSWLSSCSS